MKKTLSIILAILMIVTTIPFAFAADIVASGECGAEGGNLVWTLDSDGTLTISGIGEMCKINYYTDQPWFYVREEVKNVVIQEGVTSIASDAFYVMSNIETITIPASVKTIESPMMAFMGCDDLKAINVSPDNSAYSSDENGVLFTKDKKRILIFPANIEERDYVVPEGVVRIESYACKTGPSIDKIVLPTTLVGIDSYVFDSTGISQVIINEGPTYIGRVAFSNSGVSKIIIPSSITRIQEGAFERCRRLSSAHYLGDADNLEIDEIDNEYLIKAIHYCTEIEAKAPTCTEIGWAKYYECKTCGFTTYEEMPINPDAHSLVAVDAQVPTCTEIGWDAYEYCTACDYTTYVEIPAIGEHIDADGDTMCDYGGEQLTCEDCRRPVHDDTLVQNFVCWLIMLFNLIKSMF